MVETRVVAARIPLRVHRRVRQLADEHETTMTVIVTVALTEIVDRFRAGEEIALVRRAG